MKSKILSLLAVLLFSAPCFAQATVEDSLKNVLKASQVAAFNRDWPAWEANWVHDDKLRFANVGSTFLFTVNGWEKFKAAWEDTTNIGPKPKSFSVQNDSFNIRLSENMAWLDFDQVSTVVDTAEHKYYAHSSCIMVRESDGWKLASRINFYPKTYNSSDPADIENTLNTTGYNLINGKRLSQAIDVFKLNVKLHPKAWNTYDSLGEAYALSGNKTLAIANYKKSIQLNPANDIGKKALEKLTKK